MLYDINRSTWKLGKSKILLYFVYLWFTVLSFFIFFLIFCFSASEYAYNMLSFFKKFLPQYAYSRYAYKEKKVYNLTKRSASMVFLSVDVSWTLSIYLLEEKSLSGSVFPWDKVQTPSTSGPRTLYFDLPSSFLIEPI